jgi:adenine/guanine phosphoribosyltransferase-like PRPP-binding protein
MDKDMTLKYFSLIDDLILRLDENFDCIVAIKRSGFIMGTVMSNRLDIPLFTTSEISSIPSKFKNVLLVDDKICTGKTMRKSQRKLHKFNKSVKTASLFIEEDVFTDYWIEYTNKKSIYMFYER